MQTFDEYLKNRDPILYQEIGMQDVWQGAKGAWNKTGQAIGTTARNLTAAGAIGLGGLAAMSGGDGNQDPNVLAKQLNLPVTTVVHLQQTQPETLATMLKMPQLGQEANKQLQNTSQTGRKADFVINTKGQQPLPQNGNWNVPNTHYQSPNFDGGGPRK